MSEQISNDEFVKSLSLLWKSSTAAQRLAFVAGLEDEGQEELSSHIEAAQILKGQSYIFGQSEPTIEGLNYWFRQHAGEALLNDKSEPLTFKEKRGLVKTIADLRDSFGAALFYKGENEELIECTITADKGRASPVFRLRTVGKQPSAIQNTMSLPSLVLIR